MTFCMAAGCGIIVKTTYIRAVHGGFVVGIHSSWCEQVCCCASIYDSITLKRSDKSILGRILFML